MHWIQSNKHSTVSKISLNIIVWFGMITIEKIVHWIQSNKHLTVSKNVNIVIFNSNTSTNANANRGKKCTHPGPPSPLWNWDNSRFGLIHIQNKKKIVQKFVVQFLVTPAAEQQSDLSSHYGVCLFVCLFGCLFVWLFVCLLACRQIVNLNYDTRWHTMIISNIDNRGLSIWT